MMRYALNIGLLTSTRWPSPVSNVSHGRVMAALQASGFRGVAYDVKRSNTEDTACIVVEDERPMSHYSAKHRLTEVAIQLSQDCIAVVPLYAKVRIGKAWEWGYNFEQAKLIGPYADAWGAFNREFWLECPL